MVRSKELLLIRYISFFILIFQLFIEYENKGIGSIVFILIFIINNHLRMFYLNKDSMKVSSIILELLVVSFAQLKFGGIIIFYLIGVSFDIFALENKVSKYILRIMILLIISNPIFNEKMEDRIIYFILISVLFILLSYISRLYNTKSEAQSLYDKLRVSEEKLIEANNELEVYVHSIEEVTLLKERNRISI